ncbi:MULTISPECIES: hypothetical protein [Pseudoalteromonas]|uniref:hypothetical protein n=1 Tax=Pseudoalteromonas TaxID=53246 RepID=UPI001891BC90|nr:MULTISPECIES: hypothetical protein [Pseudoalteromonas]MCG7563482.1 hypothetical protein [Pseudoalteromonas sp. McH1-42]MEC4091186.1 hypothetical protein [Pseudoalteromonas rubra]
MTEMEFSIITRGSLREAIDKASIQIGKQLPTENIRLISLSGTLAEGWEETTNYLVEKMYHGEEAILPCADLVVDSFDEGTTTIRLFIAGHPPGAFGLNWNDGVGPYLKMVNAKLLPNNE